MQLLTYDQVAEKLACSVPTVKRMVYKGDLVKIPVGVRGARVAAEDVDAYIRRRLGIEPSAPEPITTGKRDAFYGKCSEIARRTNGEKLDVVDETLELAGEQLGRTIESVNELTSDEASMVLDQLDVRVRQLRRADGKAA